jgi:uncharacterized membrane protein YcaP (DUF421 family)
MDSALINTILRGLAIYVLALFAARIMGRKLISQMTFFDFVVGVSMGSIVANAIVGQKFTVISAVTALITLSAMSIITSYMHIKSNRIRKLVDSEPVTVVQNGTIVEKNLKNIRMTVNELMMKLREKNAFNLADVEFAIMETDGELSVLPKSEKQPLTPSQMNIKTQSAGLTKDIIMDGNIMEENLRGAGFDRKWLDSQLKSQNIFDSSEVFYAGLDSSNKLHISRKNSNEKESQGKYGIE